MVRKMIVYAVRSVMVVFAGLTLAVVCCSLLNDATIAGGASDPFEEPFIEYQTDYFTGGEEYASLSENPFMIVAKEPLSTFSVDVDVASYANCRRFVNSGRLPPVDAVRIEEFINYFDYDYPQPPEGAPLGIIVDFAECPWNTARMVARIGLKARDVAAENVAPSRLTFLIDVSGSMSDANKLPLLREAFKLLVEQLREEDRVAIVVYASSTGCVLPSTSGSEKKAINEAIDRLSAGGSTAGAAGIQLAYQIAGEQYREDANNRVILATDGDFNVGISSNEALIELIEDKRNSGIYLTVLGFGMGNYKDAKMEALADHGNGNYAYIDSRTEAEKVFVHDLVKMTTVVAQDVKIQVEFNPGRVKAYRLIGYENRVLQTEDFIDDRKDAGEMGAGQTVTACYEIIPAASDEAVPGMTDTLPKKDGNDAQQVQGIGDEYLTVNLRYKFPNDSSSNQIEKPAGMECVTDDPGQDFRFSMAVVAYGLLLKKSQYKGNTSFELVQALSSGALGPDSGDYRREFVDLVTKASELKE